MATDFLLTGGLDLSPAEKEIKEFQTLLRKVQAEAARQSPNARVAQLPGGTAARLANPTVVNGINSSDEKRRLAAQRQMIENQGKLVALMQREATLNAQIAGTTISPKQLSSVKNSATLGLQETFGQVLTPAQKSQLTRAVNRQIKALDAELSGLSGTQAANKFSGLANPVLASVGLPNSSVKQVKTINRDNERAEQNAAAAAELRAAAEKKRADSSVAAGKEQKAAEDRTTRAKNKEASEAERAANAAKKAADRKVQNALTPDGVTSPAGPGSDVVPSRRPGAGQIIDVDDVIDQGRTLTAQEEAELKRKTKQDYAKRRQEAFAEGTRGTEAIELSNTGEIVAANEAQAAEAKAQAASEASQTAALAAQNALQNEAQADITAANQQQAAAARKLSAAQARAVNLIADGTAVTREQLKQQGVKANTIRSLVASDAAILQAKQTQVAAVQAQSAAAARGATAAQVSVKTEEELNALRKQLAAQIRKGIITVAEANSQWLLAGGPNAQNFDRFNSALPVSEVEPKPRRAPRSREQIVADSERDLIDSLNRKKRALNAQAKVLESKLGPFTSAEVELIDALRRKARALNNQAKAIESGDFRGAVSSASTATKKSPAKVAEESQGVVPAVSPTSDSNKPKKKSKNAPQDDPFAETPATVISAEAEADQARLSSATTQKNVAEKTRQAALEELAQRFGAGADAAILAEEEAEAARIAAAKAEGKAAETRAAAAVTQTIPGVLQGGTAAQAAGTAAYLRYAGIVQDDVRANRNEALLRGTAIDPSYFNKGIPDGFDMGDFDEVEAAQAQLAAAYSRYAQIINLIANEFFDDYIGLQASIQALEMRLRGMTMQTLIADPVAMGDYVTGAAESQAARSVLNAATKDQILSDPVLQRQYLESQLELIGLNRREAAYIAQQIAQDPAALKAEAENIIAKNKLTAATLAKVRELDGGIGAQADVVAQRKINSALATQEALNNPQYLEALRLEQINSLVTRRARAGNPEGFFGKLTQQLGYDRSGGGSLTEFFGGGALSSIRYGLPSMLLFGAATGIGDTIREAEELQYNLSRLEGQFQATFDGQDFGPVRKQILGVAKETGLAADEIANLQIQLTGAFGTGVEIQGLSGTDLVEEQVASAAKLAQTVGLPLAEITDGLTAASLAFNSSFEDIGDVALALEQESGVLARETVSFIGDIAPVAKEAGYSLEEFSAIAAVAQQRSGRSGTALAESFGRVIPALTEQKDKLLELAAIEPALANDAFVDAIRQSDPKAILDQIGQAYANMTKEGQQATVSLLGGRREAQAIIPAIANQDLVARYTREAEASAGTLEERFLKVQETLTNALQRVGEALRQLGVELLEGGLSQAFETAIAFADKFLAVLSPILTAIGTINDALGGMPINILLAVGAWKLLTRAMTRAPIDPTTGLPLPPVNGVAPARVPRFDLNGVRQNGLPTPRFVQVYKDTRNYGAAALAASGGFAPATTTPTPSAIPRQSVLRASAASARSLGSGVISALGGGPMAGIIALTSLYGWANSQIDKEKAQLRELEQEISSENADLDFDIPNVRESRIDELKAQAEEARRALGGWQKFWNTVGNVLSEEDLLLAQASALDTTEEFREAEELFNESTSLKTDIFDDFKPRLGKATKPLRELFEDYSKFSNAALEEIDGTLTLVARGKGNDKIAQRSLDENDTRYLNEIADQLDIEVTDLDLGFVSAALQQNSADEILKLAQGNEEQINKYGLEAQEIAKAYVEYIYGVAADSPEYAKEIAEILDLLNAITPEEVSKLNIEELNSAFDLGLIGLEEYGARINAEIANLERQIALGDQTEATESQLLKLKQDRAKYQKTISEAIASRQDNLKAINEALGVSSKDQQINTVAVGLANLANPLFTDNDARLQTALDIIEAKKEMDLRLAYDSGNLAEVQRIYSEGVTIPPEVRSVLFTSMLETNDAWQELVNDYDKFVEEANDFTADVYGALATASQKKTEDLFGDFDAEGLGEDVFKQVFDDLPGITDELKGTLEAQAKFFTNSLSDDSLTPEEREQMENNLAFIVALMNFAGYSAEQIAAALAGTPGATDKPITDIIGENTGANNPLGTPPPATAKVDPQEQYKREDSVAQARLEYNKAVADQNSLEIARLEKDFAARQLSLAQTREFETEEERQVAILEAQTAMVRANQAERDAYQEMADARFSYLKAVAEVNGDTIAAAQIEVQRLQQEIAFARASGSPNVAALEGQLLLAADEVRKAIVDSRLLDFDLFATYLDVNGEVIAAAETRVKQAEFALANAVGKDEQQQALIDLLNAQKALREAQARILESNYNLRIAQTEDPVKQALLGVELAQRQLASAVGIEERNNAQKALIDANKRLNDAMQEARYSMYNLRAAELQAMDDEVGAAQVALELARAQLQDAIARGQGAAVINNARAQVINADKALRDTIINDKLDEYKWLLDMGNITQSQYVRYLEALQSTLAPGSKQFKDLALTIKQLKDGISGDLQANLPTSLSLPTLYEVRRFNQSDGGYNARSTGVVNNTQNTMTVGQIVLPQNTGLADLEDLLYKFFAPRSQGFGVRRVG